MPIWSFTFGIWLVAGTGALGKVVREPLVWAALLGAVSVTGLGNTHISDTYTQPDRANGNPYSAYHSGLAMALLTSVGIGKAVILSTVKVVLCVAIAWIAATLFRLGGTAFGVLVLQIA